MRAAYELLKRLTALYPPPNGGHHALTLPSPNSGGSFVLHLMLPSAGWQYVRFDERDLDRPVDALVAEIEALITSVPKGTASP